MADLTAEERAELRRLQQCTPTEDNVRSADCITYGVKGDVPNALLRLLDQVDALEARLQQAEREIAELNDTFWIQQQAWEQACVAWQAAHPESPIDWPDMKDHIIWLLERLTQAERAGVVALQIVADRLMQQIGALRQAGYHAVATALYGIYQELAALSITGEVTFLPQGEQQEKGEQDG